MIQISSKRRGRSPALGAVRTISLIAAAAAVLAGCAAVGPDYKRPDIQLPPQYPPDAAALATAGAPEAVSPQWWTLFNDAELNALVDEAQKHNTDILQAVGRGDVVRELPGTWPAVEKGRQLGRTHQLVRPVEQALQIWSAAALRGKKSARLQDAEDAAKEL